MASKEIAMKRQPMSGTKPQEDRIKKLAFDGLEKLSSICMEVLDGIEKRVVESKDKVLEHQDLVALKQTADLLIKGVVNKGISDMHESKSMNIDIQADYRKLAEDRDSTFMKNLVRAKGVAKQASPRAKKIVDAVEV